MHRLETLAARYEAGDCPHLAAGIRDALATGGRTLIWRALRPGGFETQAAPLRADQHPADAWNEILRTDPDAYDRPAVYVGALGPCSIHSPSFAAP